MARAAGEIRAKNTREQNAMMGAHYSCGINPHLICPGLPDFTKQKQPSLSTTAFAVREVR